MCSADIALEGHETTFPDHNGGSDGWDSKHGTSDDPGDCLSVTNWTIVCKNYDEVYGYLESVRAYEDKLIY